MPKCHICSKQTASTKFTNCSKCNKHFHLECLFLLPDGLSPIDDNWICGYCKKEGRSLRSGSISSPSQQTITPVPTIINPQSSSSLPISCDQFGVLMAKLNEMCIDMKTIKSTQISMQSDLSECKSILKKHSEDLRRHDSLLEEHSNLIKKHETAIGACTSGMRDLEESHKHISNAIKNTCAKISEIESSNLGQSSGSPAYSVIQPSEMLESMHRSHNILIRGIP